MDILLDSNIYHSDLRLKSPEIDVILDYLEKTGSKIVMPKIVLDEITELYRKKLKDSVNALQSSVANVSGCLHSGLSLPNIEVDIEKEAEIYVQKVKDIFRVKSIIPYKSDHLENVAIRAVKKQKPCGPAGQGFRDAIIWLTLLDHAEHLEDKQCTLISNNTTDFSNGKFELDNHLKSEAEDRGINIIYYKDIAQFIDKHATKIDFITREWIMSNIDIEFLKDAAYQNVTKRRAMLDQIISTKLGFTPLNIQPIDIRDVEVYEFSVYEKQEVGRYAVKADVEMDVYIGVEYIASGSLSDEMPMYHTPTEILRAGLEMFLTIENGKIIQQGHREVAYMQTMWAGSSPSPSLPFLPPNY